MNKEFQTNSIQTSDLGVNARFQIESEIPVEKPKNKSAKKIFRFNLPDGKRINLLGNQVKVVSLLLLAQAQDRAISDEEVKRLADPPDFKKGNGILNMSIHHLNAALEKKGWKITTEDPSGQDWLKRRKRVLQKLESTNPKKNIEPKKQPDLKKTIEKIFDINDDVYRKLQIATANKIFTAVIENELPLLEKSPDKLLVSVLNDVYVQEAKKAKPETQPKKINRKFTKPEDIEVIKNFIFKCIEKPIDEWEEASEKDLRERTELQKKLRNLKILLVAATGSEKDKLIANTIVPIKKHFS